MNKIGKFFSLLIKQPEFYLPFMASLFINGLIWLMIVWRLPATSTWIPLHFSSYVGIDWIGTWIKITYYPGISLLVIALNIFLAALEYNKNRRLALWLVWTGLIIQIFILISLTFLIINYFN